MHPRPQTPEIVRIRAACRRLDAVDLAAGIPDTPADPIALAGAHTALDEGHNAYSDTRGLPALRRAVAAKIQRAGAPRPDPDHEVLITNGITGGFAATVMACFRPGDEVIVFEPFYAWHTKLLELAGVVPRFVRLEGEHFALPEHELREAVGPRTRGLVLCTPANPSGKVFSRADLERIAELARAHELIVVTDEQYAEFCFAGCEHLSPASLSGLSERCVSLGGPSKSLSVTGWRIGHLVAPARLLAPIHAVHQLLYICPPTPLQHGVLRAYEHDAGPTKVQLERLDEQRTRLAAALEGAGFRVYRPQAGIFLLAEPPRALAASKDVAMSLLERTGIGAISGRGFYSNPRDHHLLRFCFAKQRAQIDEACQRLARLAA